MNRCNIYNLEAILYLQHLYSVYMGFQSKEYYHFVENGGGGEKYQLYGCS